MKLTIEPRSNARSDRAWPLVASHGVRQWGGPSTVLADQVFGRSAGDCGLNSQPRMERQQTRLAMKATIESQSSVRSGPRVATWPLVGRVTGIVALADHVPAARMPR
jgi:hypothetical protein